MTAACGGESPHPDPGQAGSDSGAGQSTSGAGVDPLQEIRDHELDEGESVVSLASTFEDGSPSLVREVIRNEDGVINHGRFQKWHKNGQLAEEGHYLRGAKHGTYSVIAESGMKTTEIEFRHGEREGRYLKWGQRGVLKERSHYKGGVLDGTFEQWNGLVLALRGAYEDGKETGVWTFWHPLEEPVQSSEGEYVAGRKQGVWKSWDEAGRLTAEETFVDGQWEGRCAEYDENGELRIERNYRAGRPHGLQVEWHPGGAKKSKITYVDGRADGPQEHWYASGQLRMQGSTLDGKRIGRWVYYNGDGTVNETWTGTYENDQRISE